MVKTAIPCGSPPLFQEMTSGESILLQRKTPGVGGAPETIVVGKVSTAAQLSNSEARNNRCVEDSALTIVQSFLQEVTGKANTVLGAEKRGGELSESKVASAMLIKY